MKILGIETSCDETAVCILEAHSTSSGQASGDSEAPHFTVLGNALYSQIAIHAQYGGVFPAIAKREHAKNLVPLLEKALGRHESSSARGVGKAELQSNPSVEEIKKILDREPELFEALIPFLEKYEKPDIDAIAVTSGPGLEPALWVGINFARALGKVWNIPVYPINHMEGHIVSPLIHEAITVQKKPVEFPALALLISGGHTELVTINSWGNYHRIGATRDDAIGEAFDKVARLLGLAYPGGPEVSKLAQQAREKNLPRDFFLPRPMIKSDDYDFSFSGIKTAVLYTVQKISDLTPTIKKQLAQEFEDAVTEVLIAKTKKALESFETKTLILGGGVTANTYIKEAFKKLIAEPEFSHISLLIPEKDLSTDNAVMIAMAGYLNIKRGVQPASGFIKAEGNLDL